MLTGGTRLYFGLIAILLLSVALIAGPTVLESSAGDASPAAVQPTIIGALGGPAWAVAAGTVNAIPYAFFSSGPAMFQL